MLATVATGRVVVLCCSVRVTTIPSAFFFFGGGKASPQKNINFNQVICMYRAISIHTPFDPVTSSRRSFRFSEAGKHGGMKRGREDVMYTPLKASIIRSRGRFWC